MGSHSGYITVAQRTVPSREFIGAPRAPDLAHSGRLEPRPQPSSAAARHSLAAAVRKLTSTHQIVDRQPAPRCCPSCAPSSRARSSRSCSAIPDLELSLTEIAARTGAPRPSVYREIQRAEQAGLVTSRKIGNTRLVRANTASPYYSGLAEILTRAFGVPAVLTEALRDVNGIAAAYIYGSWAARHEGQPGQRPVGDIDVLVLGEPDRDQLYAALGTAEQRLARPVQATIRDTDWLDSGSGTSATRSQAVPCSGWPFHPTSGTAPAALLSCTQASRTGAIQTVATLAAVFSLPAVRDGVRGLGSYQRRRGIHRSVRSRGRAARWERRQFRQLTRDLAAVSSLGEPCRPPRHMAKDVLGAIVTLAVIGVFVLQVTVGLASRCRAGPSPRAGPAACSGPAAFAHHVQGAVTMGVAACAALAAMAFIWYMFWGYKANGQARETRKAVSR